MNVDDDVADVIRLFLPKYLSPRQAGDLWAELAAFPSNLNYYWESRANDDTVLQGDGWRGFVVRDFETGAPQSVSGMVVSNSCDISPANARDLPPHILFTPLIELSKLELRLRDSGVQAKRIESFLENVRRQRVTTIFYLPEYSDVLRESVALLDNVHVHPVRHFANTSRELRFRLNQHAFYLFVMKLSVHFCRFQEALVREGQLE